MKSNRLREGRRILLVVAASIVTAVNIKSFVRAGGLVPGGFNGLTLLLQRIFETFFQVELPFTPINLLLNAIPAIIAFRCIGKRFALYSCVAIFLTGVLTDLIPVQPLTYDVLLIAIFGGIINGFAICLCLWGDATSGGTDFIAIFLSERYHIDAWNYILIGNAVMLTIAGYLFGWDKALYSILFQFTNIQVVKMMHRRYQKHTLFIITDQPQEIYEAILALTHHGATLFSATGGYQRQNHSMVYSVVSSEEVKKVLTQVKRIDPLAFINVVKTDQLNGRFYQRPNN